MWSVWLPLQALSEDVPNFSYGHTKLVRSKSDVSLGSAVEELLDPGDVIHTDLHHAWRRHWAQRRTF